MHYTGPGWEHRAKVSVCCRSKCRAIFEEPLAGVVRTLVAQNNGHRPKKYKFKRSKRCFGSRTGALFTIVTGEVCVLYKSKKDGVNSASKQSEVCRHWPTSICKIV